MRLDETAVLKLQDSMNLYELVDTRWDETFGIRNEQVVGSIPTVGSTKALKFQRFRGFCIFCIFSSILRLWQIYWNFNDNCCKASKPISGQIVVKWIKN